MSDEASPHYDDLITLYADGANFLEREFGVRV